MTITKDTKLKDLLSEYPWLKDELSRINDKFRMLNTPVGKIMLGKADAYFTKSVELQFLWVLTII